MTQDYDAIIIGVGQAGKPLSDSLSRADWKIAVVEREYVGGTCINFGCTPTKTMVSCARVAHIVNRASDYGVNVSDVIIDLQTVRKKKQAIVENFRDRVVGMLEGMKNVDLIFGEAKFTSSNTVEVTLKDGGKSEIKSDKIFINAGGRSVVPSIPGIGEVSYLNSTTVMDLDQVPEHLIILGGGYIGLEFGQMFRRFGSKVTIIQRGKQLITREDADVAEEVKGILEGEGIDVILNAQATGIKKMGNGVELVYDSKNTEVKVSGSHLLIAVGRTPNSDRLNLDAAGVETDERGYINVNGKLETSVPGIYALGDINGGPQFTHISYDDFRIIRTNLLEGGDVSTNGRQVPYVIFMDPQLGRIGLTEKEAELKGLNYKVAKIPMNYVARALETDESLGFMKAIIDVDTKKILGCAVLGIEGGEVMSILQTAMMGGLPYTVLENAVFAHPTLAESLNTLFMMMD